MNQAVSLLCPEDISLGLFLIEHNSAGFPWGYHETHS